MSAHVSSTLRRARQPARADEVVPHPNCQRANRVVPDAVPARVMQNVCCKLWYPTRDSNPESRVSETRAYADSASGAFGTRRSARRPQCPAEGNKKARGLAAQPGLGRNVCAVSRYVFSIAWIAFLRRSPCARASAGTAAPWYGAAWLQFELFGIPVIASLVIVHVHHVSPARSAPAPKTKNPERSRGPGFR
jgi:hypothetical protein